MPEQQATITTDEIEDCGADMSMTIVHLRKLAASADRGPGGREIALAITKLQEARHWLQAACETVRGS